MEKEKSIKELAKEYRDEHINPNVKNGDLYDDPETYIPYMEVHDAIHKICGIVPNTKGEMTISLIQSYITDKKWVEIYKCMSPQPLSIEIIEEYVRIIKAHRHGKNIIRRLKRNIVKQREKWMQ